MQWKLEAIEGFSNSAGIENATKHSRRNQRSWSTLHSCEMLLPLLFGYVFFTTFLLKAKGRLIARLSRVFSVFFSGSKSCFAHSLKGFPI